MLASYHPSRPRGAAAGGGGAVLCYWGAALTLTLTLTLTTHLSPFTLTLTLTLTLTPTPTLAPTPTLTLYDQVCPGAQRFAGLVARKLAASGGAALLVDYGIDGPPSSSLRGIIDHAFVDPLHRSVDR